MISIRYFFYYSQYPTNINVRFIIRGLVDFQSQKNPYFARLSNRQIIYFTNYNHLIIKYLIQISSIYVIVIFCTGCTSNTEQLRIATAANMQFVMPQLITAFTQQTGIECDVILSSSGKLTAQIQAGAPYDVFISADLKYPNIVFEKGLSTTPPIIYAYGKLVLWTTKYDQIPNLDHLYSNSTKKIALANPKTAPYGRAAREVLDFLKQQEKLESKLVFGESIAQVNQFITTGAVDYGFTAKSVVAAPNLKEKGMWIELDSSMYQPIEQGVVVLKSSLHLAHAEAFKSFLLSPVAKEILNTFGYQ